MRSISEAQLIRIATQSDVNVLILGATGTGKTTLAREIHERSQRKSRPFMTVNLATLHEGTLESELFGHEKGAFTGADSRRIGKLELANGGTVFLDEIGDLTPRLQARLLEFMHSKIISPMGSNRDIRLDVRIIAATHRDLSQGVRNGSFREDLFHRLRVLSIPLPSLCEKPEVFGETVHSILREVCKIHGKNILRISESVALRLEKHRWPGNFRELKNLLEFMVLSSEGVEIQDRDFPLWFLECEGAKAISGAPQLGVADVPLSLDFHETFERFEKEYLRRALARFHGRINLTARSTRMNKTTLIRRIRAYGLGHLVKVPIAPLS